MVDIRRQLNLLKDKRNETFEKEKEFFKKKGIIVREIEKEQARPRFRSDH